MSDKIFVTRPFFPDKQEFLKYVDSIWNNQWLTNTGPLLKEFESRILDETGSKYVTFTVNGHLALEIALSGLQLKGEVITTPFTFVSTTHSIVRSGLTPVFCDIKKSDLTIDENKIESLITKNTSAILPVHVYGHPANVEQIKNIADKHGLKVIYDAAHAFGVKLNGKSIFNYGDVSIASFHATKMFHTIEGGALFYQNNYKKIFEMLKNFGIEDEETISHIGGNAKMNEFQAAMGLINLKYLSEIKEVRKNITFAYHNLLSDINGISFFQPYRENNLEYNYAYLPILIDHYKCGVTRDQLYEKLKENNIFSRKYFHPLITNCSCYKNYNANLSIANQIDKEILCLPIYYDLQIAQVERICSIIKKYVKTNQG